MGTFLDRWLEKVVRPGTQSSTYDGYDSHVRLYLRPMLGHIRLVRLQPADVQAMMADLIERGLSAATANRVRSTLRGALGQAQVWQMVNRNVASKKYVKPAKEEVPFKAQPPNPEQAQALLDATQGDRLHALWVLALACGLRAGEAYALKWTNVDLDAATIRIDNTLHRVRGGGWSLGPVKSKTAARTLKLPAFAATELRAHRAAQGRERLAAGDSWSDHGFVFTSDKGTPLDAPNVLKRLHRALDEAGLPRFRVHDLRHACATFLIAQGASPRLVQDTLGHSTFRLTMDTYAHVLPTLQEEAADKMDGLFNDG